ncbi:Virulence factor mviN [Paenibacillus pasadenensis]|uniref:Virulence factor mviN n=1 Tax=Paenibacillus pasadenensis TaxID=217090 RepID=A0A2N5N3A3_9BACL|nr:lipid II flippase MurJ [Paenibacillus pasadenensis]PLT44813.1 Virulence factor mviN [Paenibacillus pasadenensis]
MKKNTLIVGSLTLISLMLGFGRESLIAFLFGSTSYTDAFYVAMIVPDILAGWIGFTVTNAMVPVLKKEIGMSSLSSVRLTSTVFVYVLIGSCLLALIAFFSVNPIITYLAPNFDLIQSATGERMLRIMVVAIIFSAVSGLFSGINNTYEQFAYSSLVGVFYNLFFFLSLLALHKWLGIYALAVGLVVGVVGRVVIQAIPIVRQKRISRKINYWHKSIPTIFKAMIPIFLSQALSQINQVVDRILASGLPSGQITNLNYASKLGLLPTSLIGGTIATTMYIRFVKLNNENKRTEMGHQYLKALSWILFVGLFVSGGLIFFNDSIVSFMYLHGEFTIMDLHVTSELLLLYGCFCLFYMMIPISMQYFFSFHGGKFIIFAVSSAVIVNITCGYLLVNSIGIKGLVLANGCAQAVNFFILYFIALKKASLPMLRKSFKLLLNAAPGLLMIVLPMALISFLFEFHVEASKWMQLLRGGTAAAGTALFALLLLPLFKTNLVLSTFINAFRRIVASKKKSKDRVQAV